MMGETRKPSARVLRYPGAKWSLAREIVRLMPPHERYLEPFLGSGAVFFAKPPARIETINDLDGEVYNLFGVVLRDTALRARLIEAVELTACAEDELLSLRHAPPSEDPVERARRLLVRSWQDVGGLRPGCGSSFRFAGVRTPGERPPEVWDTLPERISTAARRIKQAQVLRRDAVDLIEAQRDPNVLIYCDPPYVRSTRTLDYYAHEMTDADHERLLSALLAHPGPVLVSGYDSLLYSEALASWTRHGLQGRTQGGAGHQRRAREVVWANPASEGAQLKLFAADRARLA